MASVAYNSMLDDLAKNNINFSTDTFKMMLVNSTYAALSDSVRKQHTKRSAITAYQVTGAGYTAGGNAAAATVTLTQGSNNETIGFTITSWTSATITASGGVIYKSRGGADTADELVGYVDFGGSIVSTNGTFAVTVSTPLTFQN